MYERDGGGWKEATQQWRSPAVGGFQVGSEDDVGSQLTYCRV